MKSNHKNTVYTTDGSGYVTYHSVNKGFFNYLLNWLRNDDKFIKFSQVSKIVYDSLKSDYEFITGIKLPYYY